MSLEQTFHTPIGVFGTGAVPKTPDARDHPLERVPAVADILQRPLPQKIDRANLIWQVLNQGSEPSCVAFSTAYCCQGFEVAETTRRVSFDGHRAYIENGGDGSSGIPAERLLKATRENGFPVISSALRYKVLSYQWTLDLDTILAALVAGRLCVIACLLPSDFTLVSNGSTSAPFNKTPTNAYHQLCVTGYEYDSMEFGSDGWIFGPNSWSPLWGKAGWYRLRMGYLKDRVKQSDHFYAYSLADAPDGDSVPVPVPPPPPVGKILGVYREDRVLRSITQVAGDTDIVLQGKGFGELQGMSRVRWNGIALTTSFWSDTRIVCRTPLAIGGAKLGILTVRLASGAELQGPSLTVL